MLIRRPKKSDDSYSLSRENARLRAENEYLRLENARLNHERTSDSAPIVPHSTGYADNVNPSFHNLVLAPDLIYVLEHASCLLWHAHIKNTSHPVYLDWTFQLLREEGMDRFFALELEPNEAYIQAFYRSRNPDDRERTDFEISRRIRAGESYQIEFRAVNRFGEERWFREDVSVDTQEPNVSWHAVGICTDITDQKMLELNAINSEQMLRFATESAGIGLMVIDQSHRYRLVNRTASECLKQSPTDMIGKHVRDLHGPDYDTRLKGFLERAFAGEVVHHTMEIPAPHDPGEYRRQEVTLVRTEANDGPRVVIAVHDVTEIYRTQEALKNLSTSLKLRVDERTEQLRLSEERLHVVLDSSADCLSDQNSNVDELKFREERFQAVADMCTDGYWDLKLNSNYLFISRSYKHTLGFEEFEIENTRDGWGALVHADDIERTLLAVNACVESGTPLAVEYRIRHKNGNYLWVSSHGWLVRSADGTPDRMIGAIVDVTRMKETEERLRVHNIELESCVQERTDALQLQMERLAQVVATVPGALFTMVKDKGGYFSFPYVSRGISKLFGEPDADRIGDHDNLFSRIVVEDRPRIFESIKRSIDQSSAWHDEFRAIHATHGIVWIEGSGNPVRMADGTVSWHGYLTDVTQRKLQEEQTRQLKADAERRATLLNAVRQLTTDILTNRSDGSIMTYIADAARQLTGATFAGFGIAVPEDFDLAPVIAVGLTEVQIERLAREDLSLDLLGAVIETGSSLQIGCLVDFAPDHPDLESFPPIGPVYGVPVTVAGVPVAGLFVGGEIGAAQLSFADKAAIEALADCAAVAMHYRRLTIHQRALTHRFINMLEEERRSVAYELHDGLTQYVMTSKLILDTYSERVNATKESHGLFFKGLECLGQAVTESRRLVNGMRALTLDEMGLAAALDQLINEEKSMCEWETSHFIHNVAFMRFEQSLETGIYRVAQEALMNIRKHAMAKTVHVYLLIDAIGESEPKLSLVIRDDGEGFVPQYGAGKYGHLGLRSMRERTSLLGGDFTLESSPGSGTRIRADFSAFLPPDL